MLAVVLALVSVRVRQRKRGDNGRRCMSRTENNTCASWRSNGVANWLEHEVAMPLSDLGRLHMTDVLRLNSSGHLFI